MDNAPRFGREEYGFKSLRPHRKMDWENRYDMIKKNPDAPEGTIFTQGDLDGLTMVYMDEAVDYASMYPDFAEMLNRIGDSDSVILPRSTTVTHIVPEMSVINEDWA